MRLDEIEVGKEYAMLESRYWAEATWIKRARVVEIVTRKVEGRYSFNPSKNCRFIQVEYLDPSTGKPTGKTEEVPGRYLHYLWDEHIKFRDREREHTKRRCEAVRAAEIIREEEIFPANTSIYGKPSSWEVRLRLPDEQAVRALAAAIGTGGLEGAIEERSASKAIEAGFQQAWVEGKRKEDGTSFDLTCGAGVGSSKMKFSVGDEGSRRYFLLDATDLIEAFFRKLDASPAPEPTDQGD